MAGIRINAKPRSTKTKGDLHHIRNHGRFPAVIYGKGQSPQTVELDVREFESFVRKNGRNALMDLVVKGEKDQNKSVVMIKDIQRDVLSGDVLHADLFKVSLNDKIHSRVPVVMKGESAGQKAGGIAQLGVREVEIEGLPAKLPEVINIDISHLNIGEHLAIQDIPSIEGCKVLTEPDVILLTITAPRRTEESEEPQREEPAVEHRTAGHNGAPPDEK